MNYLIAFLISFSGVASEHNHDDHNWSGDKAAFESAKMMDMSHIKASKGAVSERIEVDKQFIMEKLAQYSGAKAVLINGKMETISERKSPKGRQLGRAFLTDEYKKLGYNVSYQAYGVFRKGSNFIAEKRGDDPSKVLIISAHIDSVRNAGANDDGSGVISALAIAKALSKYRFKYTLRVLGFDQEEIGLVGSGEYVKKLKKTRNEKLIGDIQLEMMATNKRKDGIFNLIDCDKSHSTFLTKAIAQAIVDQGLDLKINKACTTRSDHSSFWDEGMPAVVLSENFFGGDSDRCYHKACDVFDDRLDFDYMTKITQVVGSAIKEIVGAY